MPSATALTLNFSLHGQRNLSFNTPLTAAAWKTKPSWGVIAGSDQIINPDLERWYYARAKSKTVEIEGASHSVYVSHPQEVAAIIVDAARNAQK
jgi:pimeloyl-ACP methyl ester carboxylesterase